MIPRYQRVLFWILIGGIALMAAFLLHGCQQAHKRLTAFNDPTPIAAPTTASTEEVTLYLASDADGSITATSSQVALPKDASIRARILLDHLIAQYALPTTAHPHPGTRGRSRAPRTARPRPPRALALVRPAPRPS